MINRNLKKFLQWNNFFNLRSIISNRAIILSRSFFILDWYKKKKKKRKLESLLSDLEKPFSRSFASYPGHPPDKNEHGVEWNQVRPFIKFPKCAQYPDRERVETRAPFSPLAKTTRWVILPTCSYSYEHAVLLITSNYNTWSQCILRYANLVSRPLVFTPVALEEGKWDKWAATNRIMHKRSQDISRKIFGPASPSCLHGKRYGKSGPEFQCLFTVAPRYSLSLWQRWIVTLFDLISYESSLSHRLEDLFGNLFRR